MRRAGYHVARFFDRRYQELNEKHSIPVYALEDNPYEALKKDEFCVIILLQNAMQHGAVAKALFNQGYRKILFALVLCGFPDKTAAIAKWNDVFKVFNLGERLKNCAGKGTKPLIAHPGY